MLGTVQAGSEAGQAFIDLGRESAFSLGSMQVLPSSGELLVSETAVTLQPRIMQALVALTRRRGEVVSHDDLILACWGGRAVSEKAINRCVQAIRRIAETHGGFAIRTVARVGYRLTETGPTTDRAQVASPRVRRPARPPTPRSMRRPAALGTSGDI